MKLWVRRGVWRRSEVTSDGRGLLGGSVWRDRKNSHSAIFKVCVSNSFLHNITYTLVWVPHLVVGWVPSAQTLE